MLIIPEVNRVITTPAMIPPVVSIENDFPVTMLFYEPARVINLIKVNPDTKQNGRSTMKV